MAEHLAIAIDAWRAEHEDVTVLEVLRALEDIRHVLTEALIRSA